MTPASMVAMPRSVPAAVAAIPVSARARERRNAARAVLKPAAGTSSRMSCLCRTNRKHKRKRIDSPIVNIITSTKEQTIDVMIPHPRSS